MRRLLPLTLLLIAVWIVVPAQQSHAAVPTADGIYATFVVSRAGAPVGEFHCRLEYEKAPRTVANFVGLAEGSRAWVDFQRGGVRKRPFYDGITFHRVVLTPNPFVIQAGSPNGLGNDGPGYAFHDEFHPDLRHSRAGILSMANSGKDTNGSQFFVTLNPASGLDDLHSVFGETVAQADLDVVNLVRQGDVIDSVTITRNGAAAQAFEVNAQGLPTVSDAGPSIARTQSGFELNYEKRIDAEYFLFHSDDLGSWQRSFNAEFYVTPPSPQPRDVTSLASGKTSQYFSVLRVDYPQPPTPVVDQGATIEITRLAGDTVTLVLTGQSTGTYQYNGVAHPARVISEYTVTHSKTQNRILEANSVRIQATLLEFPTLDVVMDFDHGTPGRTTGLLETTDGSQFSMTGTFVISGN